MIIKKHMSKDDAPKNMFARLTGKDNSNKIFSKWGSWIIVIIIAVAVTVYMGIVLPEQFVLPCSRKGSQSLFVANFDSDTIGSTPAQSTSSNYGPSGASLNRQGTSATITIVDSAALGSQAMRIKRSSMETAHVEAVVGDVGDMPYNSGLIYIEYMAYVETQPEQPVTGMVISVRSEEGNAALIMSIYDNSYQLSEGGSYVPIAGAYDYGTPHRVHIELDMDNKDYSLCIDDEMVIENKAFLGDFTNLHALHFDAIPAILEAFSTVYVVDEIQITK